MVIDTPNGSGSGGGDGGGGGGSGEIAALARAALVIAFALASHEAADPKGRLIFNMVPMASVRFVVRAYIRSAGFSSGVSVGRKRGEGSSSYLQKIFLCGTW